MKNIRVALFSTLVLSFVAGCGASSSVAGTYHLDKAASKVSRMGADAAAARALLASMDSTIELKADGTATERIRLEMAEKKVDESVTGTWKLDGNKLALTLPRKEGQVDTQTGDYADGVFTIERGAALMMFKMTYRRK